MKNEKDQWVDNIFDSVKGSRRAKPAADLFKKIETRINASDAKIITMPQLKVVIAAAFLTLFLNIFAVLQFIGHDKSFNEAITFENNSNGRLISNFNIYEP